MESEMKWRTQIERDLKELRDQVCSIQLDLQVDDKIRCRKERKKKWKMMTTLTRKSHHHYYI